MSLPLLLILFFFIITFFWTFFTFFLSWYESRAEKAELFISRKRNFSELFYLMGAIIAEYICFLIVLFFCPFGIFDELGRRKIDNSQIPTLLVHGYFHNRGVFIPLRIRFWKDKISNVFTLNMRPAFASIEDYANQVEEKVNKIISLTNCKKVNLLTHSMGGLVARYYIQELGGSSNVNLCITLACPHNGTKFAILAKGKNGREMRPGSRFLLKLHNGKKDFTKKIISIWSDFDNMIIPHENAILDGAKNIKLEYLGHVAFLLSPRVYKIIKRELDKK